MTSLEEGVTSEAPGVPAIRMRLWIFWSVLSFVPLVFFGIVLVVLSKEAKLETGVVETGSAEELAKVLGVTSIFLIGASFFFPALMRPFFLKSDGAGRDSGDKAELNTMIRRLLLVFQSSSLVGWAIAEAAALLAGIGTLIAGTGTLFMVALALFIVSLLLTAPTTSRVSTFVENKLMDRGVSLQKLERELSSL